MLKISKTSLAAIVSVAKKASGSGQLSYQLIHLRVNGNVISAVCFNGEFGIEARAPITGELLAKEELDIYVDAKTLYEMISPMGDVIDLTPNEKNITLSTGHTLAELNAVGGAILPEIADLAAKLVVSMPGAVFKSLATVAEFASEDKARPVLQTIVLVLGQQAAQAVAADGYSSAIIEEKMTVLSENAGKSYQIPARLFRAPLNIQDLAGDKDSVTIKAVENRLIFEIVGDGKNVSVTTPLIGEAFPLKAVVGMIEQAKKGTPKASTTINRDSLMKMIAQVSAMGGQKQMFMTSQGQTCWASSARLTSGFTYGILSAGVTGEGLKVWVSTEIMKRLDTPLAASNAGILKFSAGTAPLLVEIGQFACLLMPMVVPGEDPITFGEAGLTVAARVAAPIETTVASPAGVVSVPAPAEAS
jgi:DNA polymerase III sliding clamp (beta) subunit (PCNA family)